jgi:hypothetical protein
MHQHIRDRYSGDECQRTPRWQNLLSFNRLTGGEGVLLVVEPFMTTLNKEESV